MEPIRIVVPFDIARCSPNLRLHWAERNSRNHRAKIAARVAWINAGKPTAEGKVRVSFLVRRGRRLDPDNLLAACKPVVDMLFNAKRTHGGITPDDSSRHIEIGRIGQETGARFKGHETVELIVEPIEEAQPE